MFKASAVRYNILKFSIWWTDREFPTVDLLNDELGENWLMHYSHPEGLKCPRRARGTKSARILRRNGRSHVSVYRCRHCQQVYTVYSGTVFQGKHLRPPQVILLLRGRCKGEPSAVLVRELGLSRPTVHMLRRAIGQNARRLQPDTALEDSQTQTDELFVNAGEKGEKHTHPADPARRRGNRRRAHGTYAHDRPPVIGTVGRHSGRVRLRVVGQRRREVLEGHVCRFTPTEAVVFTDEWQGYEHIVRVHHFFCLTLSGKGPNFEIKPVIISTSLYALLSGRAKRDPSKAETG